MLHTKPGACPAGPRTPAGRSAALTGRRSLFAGLVLATILLLMGLATDALSAGGLDALDVVLLALFLVTLPWTVIGFWNAAIGFVIMRFARDPAAAVTPAAGAHPRRRADHRLGRHHVPASATSRRRA